MGVAMNCAGCCKEMSLTESHYPHAMGTLCKVCIRFAVDLDREVARLREYAEQLADIEDSWTPRKAGSN